MSLDYLTLDIRYHINSDQFEVGGNVNREGQSGLVETFLRGQIGAGEDKSEPNKQRVYNIRLRWYSEDDVIESSSDTGTKGLRDGILMRFLKSLSI